MKVQLNDIRTKRTWKGKEPINHSPALNYCRKLLKQGIDPEERLDVYRGEMLAYSVTSIGEGAKWKVREDKWIGPIFQPYEPPDEKALARFALIRQNKLQGTGAGAI